MNISSFYWLQFVMRNEGGNDGFIGKLEEVLWEQRCMLVQKRRNKKNLGNESQSWSHMLSSGPVSPENPWRSVVVSPKMLQLVRLYLFGKVKERGTSLCIYPLGFLLIGTCPCLSGGWQSLSECSAAEQLCWVSLLQKDSKLHFWASEILVGFICRISQINLSPEKKMKDTSHREIIQGPKQGDSWR